MPNLMRYSSTRATSLASAATSGETLLYLVDGSTYPDPDVPGNGPYTVIVGFGSEREEVCTVTGKSGTNVLVVLRAQDGSPATAKNIGDVVVHGVSRRDFNDMLDRTTGGTVTGRVYYSNTPASSTELVTKNYVDSAVSNVATVSYVAAQINIAMPLGSIISYGGQSAPFNWMICNGQPHGEVEGSALYQILGGPNVPDLRSRFIVGVGQAPYLSGYNRGDTGGAETVALTIDQIPSHNHNGITSEGAYSSYMRVVNADGTSTSFNHLRGYGSGDYVDYTNTAFPQHTHSVQSQGGGSAHQNLPPYYAMLYIIKVA